MKKTQKFFSIILIIAMCFSLSISSFADYADCEESSASTFLSNKDFATETLNQVSTSEPIDIQQFTLYDGTDIKVETRYLQINDELTIENTRTYARSNELYSITDEYGLAFAGEPDGGGYLVANYTYRYAVIDNPNQMQTQIMSATGSTRDLFKLAYKEDGIQSSFDVNPGYNVSAAVYITISTFPYINSVTYINNCSFDKYGTATVSWY